MFYLLIRCVKLSEYKILAYMDGGKMPLELWVPIHILILDMEAHSGCIRDDLANQVS